MYLDAMQSTVASFSRRGVLGLGRAWLGGGSGRPDRPRCRDGRGRRPVPDPGALDLTTAADNIYAFAKTWGTLGDEPVFGGHEGVFFAVVGNRRAMPLFGYVGFGSLQFRILPNGDAEYRGKDATFYTDLKTGELLDSWQNPFTGKTVKVYPYINEQVTTTIPARYPADRMVTDAYRWEIAIGNAASRKEDASSYRGDKGESGKSVPFVLPWRRVGNHYLLSWDWMLEVANPVTPEGWPEASTGPGDQPVRALHVLRAGRRAGGPGPPLGHHDRRLLPPVPLAALDADGQERGRRADVRQLPQLQDHRRPGQHSAPRPGAPGAGPARTCSRPRRTGPSTRSGRPGATTPRWRRKRCRRSAFRRDRVRRESSPRVSRGPGSRLKALLRQPFPLQCAPPPKTLINGGFSWLCRSTVK